MCKLLSLLLCMLLLTGCGGKSYESGEVVMLSEETPAGIISREIKEIGGKVVESAELFDIYRGPQIGENKKSVSYAVQLRADDHTMTDEEADATVKKILAGLADKHGITLRQ